MTGIAPAQSSRSERSPRWHASIGGVALVIAFWWLATGILLAAQRSVTARVAVLALASLAAMAGCHLVYANRDAQTPRGATLSFFGGALVWGWVATTLYGGWIVGIGTDPAQSVTSRLVLAGHAIAATLYNDVVGLLAFAALLFVTRRHPVRTGAWTVLVFWCTHQLAKLNVFVGVEHPGEHYLPPYLRHLTQYFGPPSNSPLLSISVGALAGLAVWLVLKSRSEAQLWTRRQATLLAALITLAALELVLLGAGNGEPLWQIFMSRPTA